MKKEDLLKIDGMTEELATEIINQYGAYIPKSRFDEVNEAKKNAESLVKERDKQLEDLKKSTGDSEELKKQIETLQEENKTTKQNYENQIKTMKINNSVESALKDAGAKNIKAVLPFIDLSKAEIDEDGGVKGLADKIKELQTSEDSSFLFNAKVESKPSGITPANTGKPSTITKEQFSKMSYKDRVNLFDTNKELYDSLNSLTTNE